MSFNVFITYLGLISGKGNKFPTLDADTINADVIVSCLCITDNILSSTFVLMGLSAMSLYDSQTHSLFKLIFKLSTS